MKNLPLTLLGLCLLAISCESSVEEGSCDLICSTPPADYCAGDVASVYPALGACVQGDAGPECLYTPAVIDCAQDGLVCLDGRCVIGEVDPCEPNPCDTPPAPACEALEVVTWAATGSCAVVDSEVSCTYTEESRYNCAQDGLGCIDGACSEIIPDVCEPNPCTEPPLSICSGNVVMEYLAEGLCVAVEGMAQCSYNPEPYDCEADMSVCLEGACVPVECLTPEDCDDGLGCTIDECVDNTCTNTPDPGFCDNSVFCDGEETCDPGNTGADSDGCVMGTPVDCDDIDPCTIDTCDELNQMCINTWDPVLCA